MINAEGIKNILISKKPVSIIRYGDGEAMVLNALNEPDGCTMVMRRQFGKIPTWEDVLKIRQNLITAYSDADIVGIPYKGKGRTWDMAEGILRSYVTLDKLTNTDVAYEMNDVGMWQQVFKEYDRVLYVGCRDLSAGFKRYGLQSDWYRIPPEDRFTTNYEKRAHYPDHFVRVQDWISKQDCKTLCLVGAGVVGKIYCNWFRDNGGTAIDIGALMDIWTGHVTRGAERGRDVRTNENIL